MHLNEQRVLMFQARILRKTMQINAVLVGVATAKSYSPPSRPHQHRAQRQTCTTEGNISHSSAKKQFFLQHRQQTQPTQTTSKSEMYIKRM